ncbi:ATP phosphoribosyltransferase regulatory subunit [Helicobacter sp. 23-1045]
MILGYEVPQGSTIHFGSSAKLKREIEKIAVEIFYENHFEEISTPSFNFTNDERILGKRKIIRISTDGNKQMILRNDNTIDVIKILNRHLRNLGHKKWFYIQPAFSYPSTQIEQIGAECIGRGDENIASMLCVAVSIFARLDLNPILQIANMKIPRLCADESGMDIEIFSQMQVQKIAKKHKYLRDLLFVQDKTSLINYTKTAPAFLQSELQKLLASASFCEYENMIFSPLYYPKIGYYDNIFFRAFSGNRVFLRGGKYVIDKIHSSGFAIYTNEIVEFML